MMAAAGGNVGRRSRGHAGVCALMVAALAALFPPDAVAAAKVVIEVTGLASDRGTVYGALCQQQDFLKSCKRKASAKAGHLPLQLVFEDVPDGLYAVSVFHDENDNHKLDTNIFGIPKEGVGFSRDARARFGPPKFEDAAFPVSEVSAPLAISLRY